jgi:hypothetical protein
LEPPSEVRALNPPWYTFGARRYRRSPATILIILHSSTPGAHDTTGVLFSIEVTSTYYPVRNYLLTFQCAVISAIAYQFVRYVGHILYLHFIYRLTN